jgi:hypothetical protein
MSPVQTPEGALSSIQKSPLKAKRALFKYEKKPCKGSLLTLIVLKPQGGGGEAECNICNGCNVSREVVVKLMPGNAPGDLMYRWKKEMRTVASLR